MNVGVLHQNEDGTPSRFEELVTCGHLTKGACRVCIVRCWPRNPDGSLAHRGDQPPHVKGGER